MQTPETVDWDLPSLRDPYGLQDARNDQGAAASMFVTNLPLCERDQPALDL